MGRDVGCHLLQLFFFCLDGLLDFFLIVFEFFLRANSNILLYHNKNIIMVNC